MVNLRRRGNGALVDILITDAFRIERQRIELERMPNCDQPLRSHDSFTLDEEIRYCTVVGSRRIMPPDALQSKAYCTNPGL